MSVPISRRCFLAAAGAGLAAAALPETAEAQQFLPHPSPFRGLIRQAPIIPYTGNSLTRIGPYYPSHYNYAYNPLLYLFNRYQYQPLSLPYAYNRNYSQGSPLNTTESRRNRRGSSYCCCQPTNNTREVPNRDPRQPKVELFEFQLALPEDQDKREALKASFAQVLKHLVEDLYYKPIKIAVNKDPDVGEMNNLLYYLIPIVLICDQFHSDALEDIAQGIGAGDKDLIATYGENEQFFRDVVAIVKYNRFMPDLVAKPESVEQREKEAADYDSIQSELTGRLKMINDGIAKINKINKKENKPTKDLETEKTLEDKAMFIARAYNRLDNEELADIASVLNSASHSRDFYGELFTINRKLFTRCIHELNKSRKPEDRKIQKIIREDNPYLGATSYHRDLLFAQLGSLSP